jgi:predicted acyl esterase
MRLASLAAPLALLALAASLGGCLDGRDGEDEGPALADCADPAPCESTGWPEGLWGPFELASLETLRIPADDGTDLVGGLWLPALPSGVKAPTILWQSPYFGACIVHNGPGFNVDRENPGGYAPFPCQPAADSMELYDLHGRIHIRTHVEAGYAVASMNVRGTGSAGGCADPFGERESEDSAFLVEHLAAQPWSNGRVAMVGHSYSGGTPWGAAVRAPPSLKAIVASGLVTDLYTFYHTPQGLASDLHASLLTTLTYENTLPTNPESGDQVTWPSGERACPAYATDPVEDVPQRALTSRDAAFWEAHRYVPGFPDITAAVLVSHGYNEGCPFGHC